MDSSCWRSCAAVAIFTCTVLSRIVHDTATTGILVYSARILKRVLVSVTLRSVTRCVRFSVWVRYSACPLRFVSVTLCVRYSVCPLLSVSVSLDMCVRDSVDSWHAAASCSCNPRRLHATIFFLVSTIGVLNYGRRSCTPVLDEILGR